MVTQQEVPDIWSCESEKKDTRVEIRAVRGGKNVADQFEATYPDGDTVLRSGIKNRDQENISVKTNDIQTITIGIYESVDDTIENDPDSNRIGDRIGQITEQSLEPTDDGLDFKDVNPQEILNVEIPSFTAAFVEFASVEERYSWVEIPIVEVEQWIEKGDAAEIQRTAKVTFPNEWGDDAEDLATNSPRKLIEQSNEVVGEGLLFARIYWKQQDSWVINHFGWVGGVGGASADSRSKLWVYDVAELMSGVPFGETFNDNTVGEVAETFARAINDNTPVPLSQVITVPPESSEQFRNLEEQILESDIQGRTAQLSDEDRGTYFYLGGIDEGFYSGSNGELSDGEPVITGENFENVTIRTDSGILSDVTNISGKSFTTNRDTLQDVAKWIGEKLGSKIHFEPAPESVVLVIDLGPNRRQFAQEQALEKIDNNVHGAIDVLQNDALFELKPVNTLRLLGTTQQGLLDQTADVINSIDDDAFASFGPKGIFAETAAEFVPADKYPSVTVQSPRLLEAAEGRELSPPVVESDVSKLDEAEQQAKKQLAEIMEEPSEGEIVLDGDPRVMPYDQVTAFEVCNDRVVYEQTPVDYEIESVKHKRGMGEDWRTSLRVSLFVNESNFEITDSRMVIEE